MANIKQIVIDSTTLIGGLISDLYGISASQEGSATQYARSNGIDLFREPYRGHITPAQIFAAGAVTDASSYINSVPRAATIDITNLNGTQNNPFGFYILGGLAGTAPRVVRVSQTSTPSYDSHQTITASAGNNFTTLPSTGYWGEDILLYKVGGTYYVFYSWNDSGQGDVGRATLGGVYTDSFMSSTPSGAAALTGAVPHRMVEGADGKLYITNGRYVAQFDGATGANGTFLSTKYDLGAGWIATDVRKFGNYLAVLSIRSGIYFINYSFVSDARMTLWDMNENGLGLVYNVPDNYATAIFPISDTTLFAFSKGRDNTSKLLSFDGSKFNTIWESAVFTSSPDPRSIGIYKGFMAWMSGAINLLAYDIKYGGVHQPMIVNDGTYDSTDTGFIKNIEQGKLYIGGTFNSAYKIRWADISDSNYSTSKDLRTKIFLLPYKSTIIKIRIYLSQMASGSSAQFSLFKNYTASSIGTSGTDMLYGKNGSTLSYAVNGALTEYEIPVKIAEVSSFYMNVRLSGQISVSRIEVEYEPSR